MNDMPKPRPRGAKAKSAPETAPEAAPAAKKQSPLERGELGAVMQQVAKVHGPNVIRSAELRPRFLHMPTNIFPLDMSLLGGIPEGVISLVYGYNSGGKTTLAARTIAAAQKKYPDQAAAFIDVEGTYAPEWGARHGVDNETMALVQPDTGEQALDLALALVRSEEVSIIVVDSLAALTPMKEIEKSMEDLTVGEQSKLISRFCRTMQSALINERKRGHRPVVFWVNQFRMKIGTMFGDPRTLPGGEAQHFAASVKLEMKNKEVMGKDANGMATVDRNDHSFTLKKNKIGTSIREGEFRMVRNPSSPLGQGFVDDGPVVLNWARAFGHVTGGGSSWRCDGIDTKFGRLQDIVDHWYSDDEFYDHFKQRLISEYRVKNGLRPEYL